MTLLSFSRVSQFGWYISVVVVVCFFLSFLFFFFLEIPRLGVKSELQLPATTTATPDPRHICSIQCSSWLFFFFLLLLLLFVFFPIELSYYWVVGTLYILDTSPLPHIRFENSLSHSESCLFPFLMISFEAQKFLIFFSFLQPHLQYMEVPRWGVKLQL